MKSNKKLIAIYWFGTILQMGIVCITKFIFEMLHVPHSEVLSFIFLAFGGTSSTFWGMIVSKKSGQISAYKNLLKEYIKINQPIRLYGIVVMFLLILFGAQIITKKTVDGIMWFMFPMYFFQSIVFGGIEEIGWRYTFQPLVEKHKSFEMSSIITFISWGLWHYMYFYISDSIMYIQHDTFLIGLLGSCFILGAIYKISKSLWLCVMYHCLLNMFSQTMSTNTVTVTIISNVVCILLAIGLVKKYEV